MIFLIAEKADITRSGDVERGHASQRKIELAPDDVTIDPTGELGKREGECQREGVLKASGLLFVAGGIWIFGAWFHLVGGGERAWRRVLVEILEERGGKVSSILGVEKHGNLGGAEARLVEDIVEVFEFGFFFNELADFLKDALHPLNHFFVKCLIATLLELAAFAIKGDAFLVFRLHVLVDRLLLRVIDRRVIELLGELLDAFLQFADAGEALVVILLDSCALHVDLFLSFVGAVVLLEELLHIDRSDVELGSLARSHGDE